MKFAKPLAVLSLVAAQSFSLISAAGNSGAGAADTLSCGSLKWDVSMSGFGSTASSLPFWAVTNKNGLYPDSGGGLVVAGVDFDYITKPGISLYSGISLAGSAIPGHWKGMVDELYFSVGWKKLRLDLGMKDRQHEFNGLSLTGGDMIYTGNSRNFPGYNLNTDYINVPGTKGIFAFKANFADYKLLDNRYVEGVLLHNQALTFKFAVHKRVDIILALEVWSQWGGVLPPSGSRTEPFRQPQGFKDYLKIIFGASGGSDATTNDQMNALGNHLGRELIRVDWKADAFTMTFQHDIPFEDGSGMGFQNFPDGVNTIFFSFRDRNKWVTDIVYEYVFSKWQSGKVHDRPAKPDELEKNPDKLKYIVGGRDNYFNNGEYKSGWTYYGRTVGLPLFTPMPAGEDGVVLGVSNNRIVAHHIGIGGVIAGVVPYKFKASYSRNYGTYSQRLSLFDSVPEQVSMALEAELPRVARRVPVAIAVGLYGDVGELYEDNFGVTLRLSYGGASHLHRK